jgi:hypothetical protein
VALALRFFDAALAAHLVPADRLEHEPRRARLSTGLGILDAALAGGWPPATLAELCGPRSAGRTSVLHASLASAIAREQTVALVDAAGAFDPRSAEAAGVNPARLLWIRTAGTGTGTGRLALQAADVLIAAGGFGLVVIDFGEEMPRAPTAAWLRLRHAAERQGTTALVVARGRAAGAVATAAVSLHAARPHFVAAGGPLLAALETRVVVERAIGHYPAPANNAPPLRFSIR